MKRLLSWIGLLVAPLAVIALSVGVPNLILLVLAIAQNSILLLLLAFIVPGLVAMALQNLVF